ncbi:DUF2726 domain-containing protein [uncultured Helicobacter sp.]|uniref:DUF2726 domain-containing protein n=1 Tax=uncultured Helicobacter sp. TaxID=175537 RepID=UPI00374EF3C8
MQIDMKYLEEQLKTTAEVVSQNIQAVVDTSIQTINASDASDKAWLGLVICFIVLYIFMLIKKTNKHNKEQSPKQNDMPNNAQFPVPNVSNTNNQLVHNPNILTPLPQISHTPTTSITLLQANNTQQLPLEQQDTILDRLTRARNISGYSSKKILNREERALFKYFLAILGEIKQELRLNSQGGLSLNPQVSLNSFVNYKEGSEDYRIGYGLYVDFLITKFHAPLVVIEYHGGGHFIGDKKRIEDNDKTKQVICDYINVPLIVLTTEEVTITKNNKDLCVQTNEDTRRHIISVIKECYMRQENNSA